MSGSKGIDCFLSASSISRREAAMAALSSGSSSSEEAWSLPAELRVLRDVEETD